MYLSDPPCTAPLEEDVFRGLLPLLPAINAVDSVIASEELEVVDWTVHVYVCVCGGGGGGGGTHDCMLLT